MKYMLLLIVASLLQTSAACKTYVSTGVRPDYPDGWCALYCEIEDGLLSQACEPVSEGGVGFCQEAPCSRRSLHDHHSGTDSPTPITGAATNSPTTSADCKALDKYACGGDCVWSIDEDGAGECLLASDPDIREKHCSIACRLDSNRYCHEKDGCISFRQEGEECTFTRAAYPWLFDKDVYRCATGLTCQWSDTFGGSVCVNPEATTAVPMPTTEKSCTCTCKPSTSEAVVPPTTTEAAPTSTEAVATRNPCTCKPKWSETNFNPCKVTQYGCTNCDEDPNGSWCHVEDSTCDSVQDLGGAHTQGWAYCSRRNLQITPISHLL